MPTNYDGQPASISFSSSMNIASSTATNPATVTVSGTLPADFLTGVQVHIDGHQANEIVNGIHIATVTGASTFTVPVAGTTIGGATGTVQPLNATPFYQIPSDGDLDNEASIDAWAKTGTGDRDQYLFGATGQFKLARKEIFLFSDIVGTTWAHFAPASPTINTPTQFVANLVAWGTLVGSALHTPVGGGDPNFAITGATTGDLVIARLQTGIAVDVGFPIRLILYGAVMRPGIAIPTWPTDFDQLQGGSGQYNPLSSTVPQQAVIEGRVQVHTNGCNVWIQPAFIPLASGSQTHDLDGDTLLTIDVWRPTGVPQ